MTDETKTPVLAEAPPVEYIRREDFERIFNENMKAFERRMTEVVSNTIQNMDFVRRSEMIRAIRETLGGYPTIDETKGMVEESKRGFTEEIRPLSLQLTFIRQQLEDLNALTGNVQSMERDIKRLGDGHERQQRDISDNTANMKSISENQAQIVMLLRGVDGNGGVIRIINDNATAVGTLMSLTPKIDEVSAYVLQMKREEEEKRQRRAERVELVKSLPKSPKVWGGIGTAIATAAFEVLRQVGFWDQLLEGFVK